MKAILTSVSQHYPYRFNDSIDPSGSMDASFTAYCDGGRIDIQFSEIPINSFGGFSSLDGFDDEWDVEIKLTRKPKPKTQIFHLK